MNFFSLKQMFHEKLKIIFVGDRAECLEQVRHLLAETDIREFELECVPGQVAAITSLRRNDQDVCIIDTVQDGISLVAESHRVGFTVPIIMLTSNSATEVLNALRNGVSDCIVRENLNARALEESICTVIERARNMECQAQHERCYLGLVENSREIIYTHDLEGNYTFINKAGEELTGYTQEEMVTMNISQLIALDYVDEGRRIILRMLNDRRRATYKTIMVTKDRQRIPIHVNAHLLYREGIPMGVQGVAQEIQWRILETPLLAEGQPPHPRILEN